MTSEIGPIYFLDIDGNARARGFTIVVKPPPLPPAVRTRVTRLHAIAGAVTPPTPVHPVGWLPVIDAAAITTMLGDGSAVLFSSLQTGTDSVTVTTDAQGGTFRAFGDNVFQNIVTRCPSGKKIVFDTGTYEVNRPNWDSVGAGAGAVRVPKTCAGFIGREPPGTSWANILPTTRRTTIRVKPNTAPALNAAGSWFQCGYSGSVRFDYANLHFEGTEQGNQDPAGTGVNAGPGNDGHSRKLFTNFFAWTQANGNTMRDCFSTGWFGNNGAPPGEVFGIEWYHSTNGILSRCAVDGRRELGGPIYASAGYTAGNSVNVIVSECWFHHTAHSALVHFQTANCKSYSTILGDPNDHTTNHISVGRTKGDWLNHEKTTGNLHVDMTLNCFSVGGAQVAHITHSGDAYTLSEGGANYTTTNGTLEMVDPKYSNILFGGKLTYQTWIPYGGAPNAQLLSNPPITRTKAGVKIPAKWDFNTWIDI